VAGRHANGREGDHRAAIPIMLIARGCFQKYYFSTRLLHGAFLRYRIIDVMIFDSEGTKDTA